MLTKAILIQLICTVAASAADPWKTPASQWTNRTAEEILHSSPWAKPVKSLKATLRWENAAPVRLALQRLNQSSLAPSCESCYVLTLVGLRTAPPGGISASLKATGRKPVKAFETQVRDGAIVFLFHAADLYSPTVFRLPFGVKAGNDIQFATRIGGKVIRRKFSIPKMGYDDSLALAPDAPRAALHSR